MPRHLALLAIVASVQLAACQGLANAGTMEIEGRLVLRGNEPFVHPVVVVSDSEQWALLGVRRSDVERHQNQVVRVRGLVVQAATPSTARLPSLRVQDLSLRLTKPAPASPK